MQVDTSKHVGAQGKDYVLVTVTTASGEEVTLTVYESLVHQDTLIVDIDGDLTENDPSVRVVVNDALVLDSAAGLDEVLDRRRVSA